MRLKVLSCRLLIVAVASSACTVGPRFVRPDSPLAQQWSAQEDPRIAMQKQADTLWWKSFGDPVLDHLVELAYQQNLPLQVAGLRIVEARAQLGFVSGRQYPQVQVLSGQFNAVGLPQQVADYTGLGRNLLQYSLGFDALWELDFWGKYRRSVEASGASLLASVADYSSSVVSLTAEVARTYVAIRTDEVLLEQVQENARLQEQGLHIAQARFSNGATSELDPTQAATLLESTKATIPQIQASLLQARNALSTLLGQPPGQLEPLLQGPKGVPQAPSAVAVGVPAEMLRRRPDIRAAELRAAAQCARVGVAETELYPSFSLAGSIGLQANSAGIASHNLFSPQSFTYSIGPRLLWPFFNYGRIENNVRVEDARLQESLVDYRNTVLLAAKEVEDAVAGFVNAQNAAVFEKNSVQSAQRAVQIAMVEYQEGAVDYQRVLDAQRQLLQQQNTLTDISSSVATNLIALYKALGGGWEVREGQPYVSEATQTEMKKRTNWGDSLSQPTRVETPPPPAPAKQ